ncbi:MAG: hypothetical protein DRP50_06910 [Thermotoga sp.]|nr:type II toxin-antitoxin system HicA family toxin [Thermotogota bacterium]RKX52759.1 MAG: hypothetical protein DRP50_06910 [Thermotoga sp.]
MKLPRDLNSDVLAKVLSKYDYHLTRQTGSHMRLTTYRNGEHHVTIPKSKPLRIGTLNAILNDVSEHLRIPKDEILHRS